MDIEQLTLGYLDRFKVYEADTLFDLDYSLLKENRCPKCFNKLKFLKNGTHAICSSKKHRKPFIVGISKLPK